VNLELIRAVLDDPTDDAIEDLLDDKSTVFWVDWREEDDAIVEGCEAVLGTGKLAGEYVEVGTGEGYEVHVRYGDRRVKVPLTYSERDRHVTLCSLNEAIRPDYEVRFCVDSDGGDALAFLPLPAKAWVELERRYGGAVGRRFGRLTDRPNLFTHPRAH
jgi:hypothetical protein